jgi:hypothetical protein
MYCDRSAYYQKAIKATARHLKIYTHLLWLFLLFGRFDIMVKVRQRLDPNNQHHLFLI